MRGKKVDTPFFGFRPLSRSLAANKRERTFRKLPCCNFFLFASSIISFEKGKVWVSVALGYSLPPSSGFKREKCEGMRLERTDLFLSLFLCNFNISS